MATQASLKIACAPHMNRPTFFKEGIDAGLVFLRRASAFTKRF